MCAFSLSFSRLFVCWPSIICNLFSSSIMSELDEGWWDFFLHLSYRWPHVVVCILCLQNFGLEVYKQVQAKVEIILDIRRKAALATGVVKDWIIQCQFPHPLFVFPSFPVLSFLCTLFVHRRSCMSLMDVSSSYLCPCLFSFLIFPRFCVWLLFFFIQLFHRLLHRPLLSLLSLLLFSSSPLLLFRQFDRVLVSAYNGLRLSDRSLPPFLLLFICFFPHLACMLPLFSFVSRHSN
jgi:hypothetical protein